MAAKGGKQLFEQLKAALESASFNSAEEFARSPDGGKRLMQWKLLRNLGRPSDENLEAIECDWLWNDNKALEIFLCSGDVLDDKWSEAVELLIQIISLDPQAKSGWRFRLAVAVALTFSSPVHSLAKPETNIDPVIRYFSYENWADMQLLFAEFFSLNAWHMRYVVGSWASNEELIWARDNVLHDFKTPSKVGDATHHMVNYCERNEKGISVHNDAYYDGKPVTLQIIQEVGAVCGGISKFGCAMCQAFGIPALPVGQPEHCAFLWWKQGEWILSNDNSGLNTSVAHDGIQWTWNRHAEYIPLMNCAQKDLENYVLSEKLQIAASLCSASTSLQLLVLASSLCPWNFMTWKQLASRIVPQEKLANLQLPIAFWKDEHDSMPCELLSRNKPTKVSDCHERKANIVDGTGSEWWTNLENAWVEIDLEKVCTVSEVKIQWWGISVSSDYTVLAALRDGDFEKVKTSSDELESPQGYNGWSKLGGWSVKTQKIKFVLRNGLLDPWGLGRWFGIRRVEVFGKIECKMEVLSSHKSVITSDCCERANNLLDGTNSEWWAKGDSAWIQIDLGHLCIIRRIDFLWLEASFANGLTVEESLDGYNFQLVQNVMIEEHSESNEYTLLSLDIVSRYVRVALCNEECKEKMFGLKDIVISGELFYLHHVLWRKATICLSSFPKVSKDIFKLLIEASYKVLSYKTICKVSDCQERAQNIVDGTDSEWWTENENAWIELELKTNCKICQVKIQWWGTSVSKTMIILAGQNLDNYVQVKATLDAAESPVGYNGWSVFSGWDIETKFIKFILNNGSLDPWGMNKCFGVRQIIVLGEFI